MKRELRPTGITETERRGLSTNERGHIKRGLRHIEPASLAGISGKDLTDAFSRPKEKLSFTGQKEELVIPVEIPKAKISETLVTELPSKKEVDRKITLGMFSPETSLDTIPLTGHYLNRRDVAWLEYISDEEKFAEKEAKIKNRTLSTHPDLTEQAYDENRNHIIEQRTNAAKRDINQHVYTTIMQDFGLANETEAYEFYEKQRTHANAAVTAHSELVYPQGTPYHLNNEVELPMRPADLVELYLKSDTASTLKEQIKRQFLLSHIGAEIEMSRKGGADEKLSQVQRLLDEKFYAGKTGATEQIVRYGKFDSRTNQLIGEIQQALPTEPAEAGTHYKTLQINSRTLESTGENVFTLIGRKKTDSGIRKALRKATMRAEKGLDDEINTDQDVQDTHRMMLVVLGDSKSANRLVDEVFDKIADGKNENYFVNRDIYGDTIRDTRDNLTGLPTDVYVAHEAREGDGKSNKYQRRRINIAFDGMKNPLEIIVQTLEEHISAELEVGEYNSEKGKYDGPSHTTLEVTRERNINPILFNENHTVPPISQDKSTPSPRLEQMAQELRNRTVIELGNNKVT